MMGTPAAIATAAKPCLLSVESPKMILPFIKVTTVESLDIVGEKEIHLEPQSIG